MILRRIAGSRFSEVEKRWIGATAVLVGGGPSLSHDQVERARVAHVEGRAFAIAINDAYLLSPWAEVCYFADSQWWGWHTEGVARPTLGLSAEQVRERFAEFNGQKCSIQNSGANIKDDAVHILRNSTFPNHSYGISLNPGALVTGRNSGYQALNLAILAGASLILLLGFDGRPAADGKNHWFGDHPRPTPMTAYEEYRKAFSAGQDAVKVANVRVVNCSPGSWVDSFEKKPLEEMLP